jgi:5-methylcytosine-specific restriction endonuclease McrA
MVAVQMQEPVMKTWDPLPEAYRMRKDRLQDEWRERIFKRDGYKCSFCGWDGVGKDMRKVYADPEYGKDYTEMNFLQLAHRTAANLFVKQRGRLEDLDLSYRDDNLWTLCKQCHEIETHDPEDGGNANTFGKVRAWLPAWKHTLEQMSALRRASSDVREMDWIIKKYGSRTMSPPDYKRYQELLDSKNVRTMMALQKQSDSLKADASHFGEMIRGQIRCLNEMNEEQRGWTTPADLIFKRAGFKRLQTIAHAIRAAHAPYARPKPVPVVKVITPSMSKDMIGKWIDSGWVPSVKCVHPGDANAWAKYMSEECVRTSVQCAGDIEWCPDCHVTYCDFHGPAHRIRT